MRFLLLICARGVCVCAIALLSNAFLVGCLRLCFFVSFVGCACVCVGRFALFFCFFACGVMCVWGDLKALFHFDGCSVG